MQNRSYTPEAVVSPMKSTAPQKSSPSPKIPPKDELVRIFNTALVSSKAGEKRRNFSSELCEVSEGLPFKAILSAIRQLARLEGITEKQAAEKTIQTFRKIDKIWTDYIFQEGLEKLRKPRS